VFEGAVCDICEDLLQADDLQFGFKRGVGFILMLYFYVVQLNVAVMFMLLHLMSVKRSIKMNHYKLFTSLINAGILYV